MNKPKYDYSKIQQVYDTGLTVLETCKETGISRAAFVRAAKLGHIKTRSKSEAISASLAKKPRKHTDATKEKLRDAMNRRRANGYDWTLGRNRHTSEPSWPEQFWTKVIENEFSDKDFIPEYPMGRYSLDFAWPHLKKCIEIDGEQHYTDAIQAASDVRKDAYLAEQGWQVMRIRWKDCFKDPKSWIANANEFIAGWSSR